MGILNKKIIDPVERHQAISDDAFSLFRETIKKLDDADDGLQEDIDLFQKIMDDSIIQQDNLIAIRKNNVSLNNKIKEFFNV
jgi:hypothetical protein